MKKLLTDRQFRDALTNLFKSIESALPKGVPLAVVGIRTRGEILARRAARRLSTVRGKAVDLGILDITFYRDDLSLRKGMPLVRATEINFDLDGKVVLLIDDVLQTGRSVRAAMDALMDFGRPRAIRLAVLIDRGGRELPICPDFLGAEVTAPTDKRVQVKLKEIDGQEGVFLVEPVRTRRTVKRKK